MEDIYTGLLSVLGFAAALAMATELIQYVLIYRTRSFRMLKANLEKHAAKVEESREGSSKSVKKASARLQGWEEEAAKQIFAFNFKSGAIVMASVMLSFKLVPRVFGGVVVARLPFEPPAFLQKATQRGLEPGADPRAASAFFIFMLCQAFMRAIIGKLTDWGPSRRMQEVKPSMPKAMKQA